ncbi:MAG TPA: OmpA family protein [Hyphomonadaceae bacterium]|jgi:OOP family OmpA-OmpF porin|nr:OmpA family protein [Hyphomonadaceae bacterium]
MFRKLVLVAVAASFSFEAVAQQRTVVTSAPTAQQYVDLLFKDEPQGEPSIRTRGIQLLQPQPVAAPQMAATMPVAPQVQAPIPVAVSAPAAPPPAEARIIAAPVRFAYNSTVVPADFRPYLVNLAEALKRPEAQGKVVIIAGHTDSKGDAAYNMTLSARRARAVEQFLIAQGVGAQQVVSTGRGETQLIPGHEQDDMLNRRVEFSVASF